MSKREVELLVARLAPRPEIRASVRRLPSPKLLSVAGPAPDTSPARHAPEAASTIVTEPTALESGGSESSAAGMIFDRALKLLFEDIARKKLAVTSHPRLGRPTAAGSRHIPAHVRRAVWLRDGGQCAFVAIGGRRCRERAFVEFHHVEPYAIGGEATAANLSLRCRAHNLHEAERVFGCSRRSHTGAPKVQTPGNGRATRPGAS